MTSRQPFLIDDPARLPALVSALRGCQRVAVDTESNSLHAYRERVCFLQIAAGGQVWIVDTLAVADLSLLAPFFADERVTKILHGADYDVVCLARDFGIRIGGLFDTMLAAQILGHERLGLGALVERYAQVSLDKKYTRHDWGARPVAPEPFGYLVEDVLHLETVHAALSAELAEADLEEEAGIEFERVSLQEWSRTEADPEAFRRIKGSRDLDQAGLSVLRELHALRERLAASAGKPPFKVIGNHHLLAVSHRRPQDLGGLRDLRMIPPKLISRHGRDLVEAVRRGMELKARVPLRIRASGQRPPDEQVALSEALRNWRRQAAEADRRTTLAVLPNHVIERIAARLPTTRSELGAIEGLGARRLARYGDAILGICLHPPRPGRSRRGR